MPLLINYICECLIYIYIFFCLTGIRVSFLFSLYACDHMTHFYCYLLQYILLDFYFQFKTVLAGRKYLTVT